MIFTAAIFIAIGVIAFFHYLQGFFSATISAVLAALAAFLAFSFYEPVVHALLGGKMANQAHGMVLLVLFAVFYLIPRVAFDKMVPGNLRLPALVDRIGGGVMGVVAGVFAVGTVAVAAQAFPFMPDVAGYTKYEVTDKRPVSAPTSNGRNKDALIYDEVVGEKSGRFDEAKRSSIMALPVDDIVVGLVRQHSNGGPLAGSQPLVDVHPDLLQEYFGQRLGTQTGSTRIVRGKTAIRGVELYRLDAIPQVDYGYAQLRGPDRKKEVAAELRPAQSQVLLVVRAKLSRDAGDAKDFLMRFSPGSVRLVAGRVSASGEVEPANYFPVGTIDGARQLVANRIDDFMFADLRQEDRAVDFAFLVDRDGLLANPGGGAAPSPAAGTAPSAGAPAAVAPGVFLEINRMGVVELAGNNVLPASAYHPNPQVELKRPIPLKTPESVAQPAPTPVAPTPAPAAPLKDKLVGTWSGTVKDQPLVMTFKPDGSVAFTFGANPPGTGTWSAQNEASPTTLNILRKLGGGAEEATTVNFNGDDAITMTTAAGVTTNLTRKK